jgi:hypothetical protein
VNLALAIGAVLFGSGGVATIVIALMQGRAKKKQGATGKIVDEVEARRKYVAGVYEDYDWEARQRRYWQEAYYSLLGWVHRLLARIQGMLPEVPEPPPLPPFPERPARQVEPESEGSDA